MNLSKVRNDFTFKDNTENLFKINSYECRLPCKISKIINFDNDEFSTRFCGEYLLCVGKQSMLTWRYFTNKKSSASYVEYQLPYNKSGHHAKQALLIKYAECIIVTDEGNIRYWPQFNIPNEYVDYHIIGVYQDKCLLVEILTDGVLVAVFQSMKVIIIDLRDYGECGLTYKVHSQPRSIISGMGRYLASFIVTNTKDNIGFKNIKVNDLLPEETELLLMVDNNIDSLCLDVLHNGQYQRGIFQHESLKKIILDSLFQNSNLALSEMIITFRNFDFLCNLVYVLVHVQLNEYSRIVLFTYNMKLKVVDSVVSIDVQIMGEVELSTISDEGSGDDQPCLLVAIKDNHAVYIVEVLTGAVKCILDTKSCIKSNTKINTPSLIAWTCPTQYQNGDTKVLILTASNEIVTIKNNINPQFSQSFRAHDNNELGFNISNASFSDWNLNSSKATSEFKADISFPGINQMSFLRPSALSTPKSKFIDNRDKLNDSMSVQKINVSTQIDEVINGIIEDSDGFGIFKKSVILCWLGYKSQAKRTIDPLIERAEVSHDIPLSMFALNIVRDIIDEYPSKDPRWAKNIQVHESNGFMYSNKSLILQQQLLSKKEALQKLFLILKENGFDLFGPLGSISPMSAYTSLYMQDGKNSPMFGCGQVSWPVAYCLGFGVELLAFVRVLNEIVCSNNSEEINQIMAKCCQHVLAKQGRLTPLEIISQEISLIPRFICDCAEYLKEKHLSVNISDTTKDISILIGNIISACLRSSLISRRRFDESFLSSHYNIELFNSSMSSACWITENKPIGILDSIIDIIKSLFLFSDSRIFESAVDIGIVILDCFKERIHWMGQYSNNDVELQKLEKRYFEARYELISKIVEDRKAIDVGLTLADRFVDFQWLTVICDMLDNESKSKRSCNLEQYLRKYSELGFSEFVLDWYQDKLKNVDPLNQGKLLAKIQVVLEIIQRVEGANISTSRLETSSSSQVISKFLEKTKDLTTKWLHEIEIGDFSEAALTLTRLGEIEESSLYKKKSLMGLAKLSFLADFDMTTEETNDAVDYIDKQLELINFQESIPAEVLKQQLALQQGSHKEPVIGITQIVKSFLAAAKSFDKENHISYFMKALDLLSFCSSNPSITKLSLEQFEELFISVWSCIIHQDDWSTDKSCESVFYKILKAALAKGLSKKVILPNLQKLFEFEKSLEDPKSTEFEYFIRKAFESAVGEDNINEESESMICN